MKTLQVISAALGRTGRGAFGVALLGAVGLGCGVGALGGESVGSLELGVEQADGIVAALNRAETTVEVLIAAAVPTPAARNLMAHRNGPDGRFGTADDDRFDDIDEVDGVYWVGPSTLARLAEFAATLTVAAPAAGVWDDVSFTAREVEATLTLVNTATQIVLDDDARLDRRAAANIVARRPLADMDVLAAIPYVGQRALTSLRDFVRSEVVVDEPIRDLRVADILASPGVFDGAVVRLDAVVVTMNLSRAATRTGDVFDFEAWGYEDWYADGVEPQKRMAVRVDAGPRMYRRASVRLDARSATDTRLNLVNLVGRVRVGADGPELHVESADSSELARIEVEQRWLTAGRIAGLASLWSRENGVVQTTSGWHMNRIPAALLNVHPAVVWHDQQGGGESDIGAHPECYDCSVNPFTDDGDGLFRTYVDAWKAAGRP